MGDIGGIMQMWVFLNHSVRHNGWWFSVFYIVSGLYQVGLHGEELGQAWLFSVNFCPIDAFLWSRGW